MATLASLNPLRPLLERRARIRQARVLAERALAGFAAEFPGVDTSKAVGRMREALLI